MNMIALFLSFAILNTSRTNLAPSPMYFRTSSLPVNPMNVLLVLLATAFASNVFPVPGRPCSKTPDGMGMPNSLNLCGLVNGKIIASSNSRISFSKPPISSNVVVGRWMTSIARARGSFDSARTCTTLKLRCVIETRFPICNFERNSGVKVTKNSKPFELRIIAPSSISSWTLPISNGGLRNSFNSSRNRLSSCSI